MPQLLHRDESDHAFVIARFSPKPLQQTGSQAFIPMPKKQVSQKSFGLQNDRWASSPLSDNSNEVTHEGHFAAPASKETAVQAQP